MRWKKFYGWYLKVPSKRTLNDVGDADDVEDDKDDDDE